MRFEEEFNAEINHEILQKHRKLLKVLAIDSQVVCVCRNSEDNFFYLLECCDDFYTHKLTKEECVELSELFQELANEL